MTKPPDTSLPPDRPLSPASGAPEPAEGGRLVIGVPQIVHRASGPPLPPADVEDGEFPRDNRAMRILGLIGLTLGVLATSGLALAVGGIFYVYVAYARDYVPIEEKLKLANAGLTEIYDRGGPPASGSQGGAGGVLLGSLANPDAQLLNPVPLAKISPWMVKATVSTEDNTFYENPGISITGLMRAGLEYLSGGLQQGTGGSSITQQLVKNVYICPSVGAAGATACSSAPRTLQRKMREIAYALELENESTKDQVLGWYLNQISYAGRYVGVQSAAQGYFHKDAVDLTLAESAILAGIPAGPTAYSPRLNCAKTDAGDCILDDQGRTTVSGDAKKRQEDVLDLMVVHGRATKAEADAAKAEVVKVFPATNTLKAGIFIDSQVEPRLERMCNAGLLAKIDGAADCRASVHSAGYKVTTSLDWAETDAAQKMVQDFVTKGLANGCGCYDAALATIDPSTGQIRVYVPNRDPDNVADRRVAGDIDQLTEINQPGSSFKPVVYLNWFDRAVKAPMSTLWDTNPLDVEGTQIVNSRGGAGTDGLISARAALGGSQNVGAFRAATEGGVDNVIDMAKKVGITTLQQKFDPTFYSHGDVTYGASVATGGANIRAIDMAYVDTVIANMGVMVGTPTLATTIDPKDLRSTKGATGADSDEAIRQASEFARGNIRLPGTRELDPIVVLEVRDNSGKVIYTEPQPQRRQVVDAGSVWLLHSIMSDCTARSLIWVCGTSNNDNQLDFFLDGKRVPGGVKTGTQQGPKITDTLETWMTGYTRYAGTAVWVGNATNELVRDGAAANFASADTTITLFKNWMAEYHRSLKAAGVFVTPDNFDAVQPKNVALKAFKTPSTSGGLPGGCDQVVQGWQRTDVKYDDECAYVDIDTRNGLLATDQTPVQSRESKGFRKLPAYKPEAAIALAKSFGIPLAPTDKSTGKGAVEITSPATGATLNASTPVIGSVLSADVKSWKLELARAEAPSDFREIGKGEGRADNVELGRVEPNGLQDGIYTVRLTAADSTGKEVTTSVTFNVRRGSPSPAASISPSPSPSGTPRPPQSPSPTATNRTGTPQPPTPTATKGFGTPPPPPPTATVSGATPTRTPTLGGPPSPSPTH